MDEMREKTKQRHAKIWVAGFLVIVIVTLFLTGMQVVRIDPLFHYHKPLTDQYYYYIDGQRYINDGIMKQFDYDAMITGTSMVVNFKTSEMDDLFQCSAIKVPYSGGSYKEINDAVAVALEHQPDLKTVIRGLDMDYLIEGKNEMHWDGLPEYLYDDNPLNDVRYLFNRDVIFQRVYRMIREKRAGLVTPGIVSFDTYSNNMANHTFGIHTVCPDGITMSDPAETQPLTEEEKETILDNIRQNVTALPAQYPDVTFYYFFPPYSALWWLEKKEEGSLHRQVEAERVVIEELLKCDNIKLYSFNTDADVTTDLNNYGDIWHYGDWINTWILQNMQNQTGLLTKENYQDYLTQEEALYQSFDYESLNAQEDYEDDAVAAGVL